MIVWFTTGSDEAGEELLFNHGYQWPIATMVGGVASEIAAGSAQAAYRQVAVAKATSTRPACAHSSGPFTGAHMSLAG